jgi:hypothetical protein
MAEVNFLDGDSYGLRKVRYVPREEIKTALASADLTNCSLGRQQEDLSA